MAEDTTVSLLIPEKAIKSLGIKRRPAASTSTLLHLQ